MILLAVAASVISAPRIAMCTLIGTQPPTLTHIAVNDTKFNYSPIVPTSHSVVAGSLNSALTSYVPGQADFFVLVDFNGYIGGTAFAPTGWTVSVANTFGTPLGGGQFIIQTGTASSNSQQFVDNPNVPDLLFSYTSGPTLGGGASDVALGQFGGDSIFSSFANSAILEAQDHTTSGGSVGNADIYQVPISVSAPEPATVTLLAAGLVTLLSSRKRT